jgi:hypothetical protein
MNCKPGDTAYVVVPPQFMQTLDGKFVTVGVTGGCDLGTFVPASVVGWLCEFAQPWTSEYGTRVIKCYLLDAWLRPIRDPGDDAVDETLIFAGDPRVRKVLA